MSEDRGQNYEVGMGNAECGIFQLRIETALPPIPQYAPSRNFNRPASLPAYQPSFL